MFRLNLWRYRFFATWKHWILISVRNFLLIVFEESKDEYENVYEPDLVINRKVISNDITTIVRPVLEYAAPVWQNVPDFLSYKIESIQKRAMRIIFPLINNNEALNDLNLTTLSNRRAGGGCA